MNVIKRIQDLYDQATKLEEMASGLRTQAKELKAMFLDDDDGAVDSVPDAPAPKAPVVKATPTGKSNIPSVGDIRAKAEEYGVNVDDIMPKGKNPTLQQKQDAMKRIVQVKRLMEAPAAIPVSVDPALSA